ncbi:CPBP family intramembrane metalloprotease [Staphylococcus sp. NRL 16/872]|uniref:CPBP family intramembrane glutamic endopeptidase n=1 Tax=Staphylococcus sp. NRL 16/872 TaxID=2930131 RepID=UPI001FB27E98|nr:MULTISPECIES: CPBP family intramembrane glutamic endopeptidase [unclassified Staphylococcus]MCJ1655338.1 CPBP family intramembrane metalloprotease [Staphylococcus sp. NRL 21/187]MCJ1661175.1 CPBP family intramembrane metalloprotease [Staphylococcus sp. NRL 18/288]MCJ1667066.1 CPBP family intramembrane metalloprotease [Staphylococcus sp. NRL 19/737]WEN69541.1 CPBP family intramembrane metalloprotease [Staphylococcus sp. NRL 16/872]
MVEQRKFSISRIIAYMLLTIFILLISGELSGFLIEHGLPKPLGQLLSGLMFTISALIIVKYIHSKNPSILREIKLVGYSNKRDLIIALILPFLITLAAFGIVIGTGMISNFRISTDIHIWSMFLFNCIFAILYEAFPEEVLIRGLILNELRKKFNFMESLFIQPLLFSIIGGVAHIVTNLIHMGGPEIFSVIEHMIQFYLFGFVIQLYREFSGSLFANMLFHLVCLETTRFIFVSSELSIIKFDEIAFGFTSLVGLFFGLYLGSAIILSFLLWLRKRNYEKSNK